MKNSEEVFVSGTTAENLIATEHRILKFWKQHSVFERLREKNSAGPMFRFLDGPITANNPMGVHHAWGRTLKDLMLRYKSLQGYRMHYQPGFDCQGLWVEVQVERELGLKTKADIENFGLESFSRACKERVEKYSSVQAKQSERLGMWLDFENAYYTHLDYNIDGIWRFLQKCSQNGWIYKDHRVMPWSPRTQTSLSEHEMAGSYKDLTHTTVTVKVYSPDLDASLLIWTTTPWTLAANAAVAVNPTLTYVKLKVQGEDKPIILGEQVAKSVLKGKKHEVMKKLSGSALVGARYLPIFPELPVQAFEHKVVSWDEVESSEGTGVVHIAPGCGPEDFELGSKLGLPAISPANEEGVFVSHYDFLSGKSFLDVAPIIVEKLSSRGALFDCGEITHSCAVCWRTGVEVIYRLVDEWFISSDELRPRLLAATKTIEWNPPHMESRMQDWLQNMGDWCISRKRYWGLPLPFYESADKSETFIVGSKSELRSLAVKPELVDALPELHRPWIDEIEIRSPRTGNILRRVPEVGDCWLDAGITPFSTRALYENPEKKAGWAEADYIVEMSEQVRLWFYSMLFMSVTLVDKAPYKKVWTHERVTNEDGSKFSKTGKMIEFNEGADQIGADTMRYLFTRQPLTSDVRFGFGVADEARHKIVAFLNSVEFFKTYARIDQPKIALDSRGLATTVMDKWLAAARQKFLSTYGAACERYDFSLALQTFERFADDLSNFYIRNSRRRFWKGGLDTDKQSAYSQLFWTLHDVCVVLSPIIPLITEGVWQDVIHAYLPQLPSSVHLSNWPRENQQTEDDALLKDAAFCREIISSALNARVQSQHRVRQPLQSLELVVSAGSWEAVERFKDVIRAEINVKEIKRAPSREAWLSRSVELEFRAAGPVFRERVGEFKTFFAGVSTEEKRTIAEQIASKSETVRMAGWNGDLIPVSVFKVVEVNKPTLSVINNEHAGYSMALDLHISEELQREGIARELVRHIQVLRKDSGLDIQDRIELSVTSEDREVEMAFQAFSAMILDETLATPSTSATAAFEKTIKIGTGTANLRISKIASA